MANYWWHSLASTKAARLGAIRKARTAIGVSGKGGPAQVPEYLSRHTHRTAFSNERIHYTMHKRWCSQCVPMTRAANTCTEWMAQSLCAAFCCTCCQPGSSGYVTKGCWHQAARARSSMRPDWLCRCQHATRRRWRRRRHPEMPDLEDVQDPRRQSPQQRQAYIQKKSGRTMRLCSRVRRCLVLPLALPSSNLAVAKLICRLRLLPGRTGSLKVHHVDLDFFGSHA